jgi:hypothetical protein
MAYSKKVASQGVMTSGQWMPSWNQNMESS